MNLIGKTTINPVLFYTGKISGYFTWLILLLALLNIHLFEEGRFLWIKHIAVILLSIGLVLTVISIVNLGSSTRLGLPIENTTLRTGGLYRYSRNPIYIGFNLLTIASILYLFNITILILGLYSIIIYHFIILGEERFMENRFGNDYVEYKQKVRRYL
jgi:protein-S-isoprenylcysteine O-methyltransferase Ste14